MSPGPTFDRVYVALKEQLKTGCFAPGDHLEPAAIGEDLHASITPVRDALHRLAGEGLVEAPRHDGFRVPAPTEAELRDLYGWNGKLLTLAVTRSARAAGLLPAAHGLPLDPADGGPADETAALFLEIAAGSESGEHIRAVASLNDRLASARRAETALFPAAAGEREELRLALRSSNVKALRRLIARYHKVRQRCVPEIRLAMSRPQQARSLADP